MKRFFIFLFCSLFLSSCWHRLTVSSEDLKNTGRQILNGERITFREARLTVINLSGIDCLLDFNGNHYICSNASKIIYSIPLAGFIGDNREIVISVVAIASKYPEVRSAIKRWMVSGWRYQSNHETWILEYSKGSLVFRYY